MFFRKPFVDTHQINVDMRNNGHTHLFNHTNFKSFSTEKNRKFADFKLISIVRYGCFGCTLANVIWSRLDCEKHISAHSTRDFEKWHPFCVFWLIELNRKKIILSSLLNEHSRIGEWKHNSINVLSTTSFGFFIEKRKACDISMRLLE